MNIENLKPFDKYLIALDRLYASYKLTESQFKQGKWEIDWCNRNANVHFEVIQNHLTSLKENYKSFKKIYSAVLKDYSNLTEYERNIFNENKPILKNAENLIQEIETFLDNNNICNM